ncbi:MAG: HD-GYP domain-containing protein [Planctomycetes bacterium]|nr:HD-GYP domain-containing protein [Planctomycetota bacterium]
MAWFVEARDPYTGGHLWRVSKYARLLADTIGLSEADAARAGLGGFLHDLGKIAIPDGILRKPGPLTPDEFATMRTHPQVGIRMLAGHPLAALVGEAVQLHHERMDGRGYPHGLVGEAIPLVARIVGVCDAFDAMSSQRPYRPPMTREAALSELRRGRVSQFDGRLVDAFVAIDATGNLEPIVQHSDEGIPLQSCPMCGPTLAVRRDNHPGDHIFCGNCASEFILEETCGHLVSRPTGRHGTPADLEPAADVELIARTVHDAVAALPAGDWIRHEPTAGNGAR